MRQGVQLTEPSSTKVTVGLPTTGFAETDEEWTSGTETVFADSPDNHNGIANTVNRDTLDTAERIVFIMALFCMKRTDGTV